MRSTRLELMRDHVRMIHRAVTGGDPPDPRMTTGALTPSFDEVEQRFVELESVARAIPTIAERVAPFSFQPPLDVSGSERELIVELGVPGASPGDVDVDLAEGRLVIAGALTEAGALEGRIYFHAELPRGPFRREVRLPEPTSGPPRVEIDNGVVRVRLAKRSRSPWPRA